MYNMSQELPVSPGEREDSFEQEILTVKAAVQNALIIAEFGSESDNMQKILAWVDRNGRKINDIFHENPNLVKEYYSDSASVIARIKSEIGTTDTLH